MRLLGVDIDLCICPSDKAWYRYLAYKQIGIDLAYDRKYIDYVNRDLSNKILPYDLGEMFPEVENPYEYWRSLDYSQFKPIEGSVEALRKLSQHFGIVFISRTKGSHSKSKYYWLEEHFPFLTEYIVMHKKGVIQDCLVAHIDDRLDVLEKFEQNKRILFKTPYEQSSKEKAYIEFDKWGDEIVHKICREYLK